jgi:hypothetical protein
LIEFVLPKQDVAIPRCLAGCEVGRVEMPPLDAKASSWSLCCQTFRSGSEISGCFGATTPAFFSTEASEAELGPADAYSAPRGHTTVLLSSFPCGNERVPW